MKKVTDGRKYLGEFSPLFAEINDDILFGKVWEREDKLPLKLRSIITISALMGAGIVDDSLKGHLEMGKQNGITKIEIVEIITQLAFYTGWPKAWSVFSKALEIYKDEFDDINPLFGKGELVENDHFNGKVYVKEIYGFDKPVLIDTVTFSPGVRKNWHIHKIRQTLLVTDGYGYYQEEGKKAIKLKKGDIVEIPANVKHWHGATKDSYLTHIAIENPSKGEPIWFEPLSDIEYNKLK